jgi:hypothetical protein
MDGCYLHSLARWVGAGTSQTRRYQRSLGNKPRYITIGDYVPRSPRSRVNSLKGLRLRSPSGR